MLHKTKTLLHVTRALRAAHRDADIRQRLQQLEEQLDSTGSGADGAAGDGHVETARRYYDLCSDFMLMGWGEALHFAPLSREESLEDSKTRHQRLMIEQLELRAGMTVLDIGCGVGGPMRRVATEAGVRVTGVNNSRVQLDRARTLDAAVGLEGSDYVECSFMDMSTIADATFDRGYAIESTCHAPDKVTAFAEIHRVLKPGALFWCQEMCLTDAFDPNDARHQAIQQELRRGIALKRIATFGEVNQDLESAGFEVIEGTDLATAPAPR